MLLARACWLLILRKVFAKCPADEEAVAWFLSDAEQQGVPGNIQVSSVDDGRIQLFRLPFTHLNDRQQVRKVSCVQNKTGLSFGQLLKRKILRYPTANFPRDWCVMSPKYLLV